jgi:hypothetical protein
MELVLKVDDQETIGLLTNSNDWKNWKLTRHERKENACGTKHLCLAGEVRCLLHLSFFVDGSG